MGVAKYRERHHVVLEQILKLVTAFLPATCSSASLRQDGGVVDRDIVAAVLASNKAESPTS